MKKNIFIQILAFFIFMPVWAQESIPAGSKAYQLIEQSLQHLYNTEIEETNRLSEQIHKLAPGHPACPLLKALAIRTAYYPIDTDSKEFNTMKKYLYEALESAEKMLEKEEDQPEGNFFALASYGLLALYENQDGNSFKAVSLAKDAYKYLKKGSELKEKYPEFYFTTGLYNYYREKYPELHPIYKPFMWFFKSGDMSLGLKQMEKSGNESVFMQAEAKEYLSHIYLRYENKPETALKFARSLTEQFPQNLYFATNFVDAALASGVYQGLDSYVDCLTESEKPYYQMAGELFKGMLLEKRDNNWQKAEQYYVKSLSTGTGQESKSAEDYRSYAYAGLARIAQHEEKYEQAKKLYKQALAAAQYPHTEEEAKKYLN